MARKANDRNRAIRQNMAELGNLDVKVIGNREGVRGFQSDMTKRLPVFNRKTASREDKFWHALSKQVAKGARVTVRHPSPTRFKLY